MTQNFLTSQPIQFPILSKRMLIGALIGLILISTFLLQVKNPDPTWGKLWMIKPLILVPLAGAGGGLFYYAMDHILGNQGRWSKIIAIVLSVFAFIIALWLGTVLGLNGTLWH